MAVRITLLIRVATGGDKPARGVLTRWAERVGTSTSTVTRWRGGTIPDPEWWPKLAEVLEVSEAEVHAATETAVSEPTIAGLYAKLDHLTGLVQRLVDNSKPRRGAEIETEPTPASMPRPALHRRG